MGKFRRIIGIALVAAILSLSLIFLTACDEETASTEIEYKDKAIILVTALTSGGLYDSETGEAVWDPFPEDASYNQVLSGDMIGLVIGAVLDSNCRDKILSILKYSTEEELANNWLWQICLNEDGESNNPNLVPANGFDGKIQYGALAAYRDACLAIREVYGDEWDVEVFNYDWRIDNRENSRLLEEYIDERGYDEVIFSSHSMGGPVVAGYLARSAENRERTLAYIPNSPAFYGSVDALYYLDDPIGCVYDIAASAGVDLEALGIADDLLNALAKPLLQNMTSVMQLLPFPQFIESEWYADGTSCARVNGEYIQADKLYDFYCSRSWAKKANGQLKPAMADLQNYWKSMMVDTDADGEVDTFSCDLIDTYYFIGDGITTKKELVFASATEGTFDHANIIYGDGDGTMPVNSCLGGHAVSDIADGHLFIFEQGGHGNVGADWTLTGNAHLGVLAQVIERYNNADI